MPRRWEGTLQGCVGAPGLEPQPASRPGAGAAWAHGCAMAGRHPSPAAQLRGRWERLAPEICGLGSNGLTNMGAGGAAERRVLAPRTPFLRAGRAAPDLLVEADGTPKSKPHLGKSRPFLSAYGGAQKLS